jgi:hypothetical protein
LTEATSTNRLYNDIVAITSDYLGPAAQRFIDRQISNHLNKPPDQLTRRDIKKLVDWSRVAIALLTDDKQIVNDYTESLLKIAAEKA